MIQRLHRGLAPCAEVASTDRIQGIAFDLLDCGEALPELLSIPFHLADAFHYAYQRAAPRGALRAHRWMPLLFAGDDFLFGHEKRNQRICF